MTPTCPPPFQGEEEPVGNGRAKSAGQFCIDVGPMCLPLGPLPLKRGGREGIKDDGIRIKAEYHRPP